MTKILLKYHDPKFYKFLIESEIYFEAFLPPWVMTFFNRFHNIEFQI